MMIEVNEQVLVLVTAMVCATVDYRNPTQGNTQEGMRRGDAQASLTHRLK